MYRASEIAALVFTVIVLLAGLVMVISGGAAAQSASNTTAEYIDPDTRLISAELDDDSTVSVVIESEIAQRINVVDPAGYWSEGEPASRRVVLDPGDRVRVNLTLESYQGSQAVVLDTRNTVHPIPLKEPTQNLGFLKALNGGEGIAWGAFAAFTWFLIAGVYVLWIEGGEPEVA